MNGISSGYLDSTSLNHLSNLGSPVASTGGVVLGQFSTSTQQQCVPYKGTLCSQFLLNQTVLSRGDLRLDQLLEHKLRQLIQLIAAGKHISPHCHRYAIPALCFYAYPLCDSISGINKPRHVRTFNYFKNC